MTWWIATSGQEDNQRPGSNNWSNNITHLVTILPELALTRSAELPIWTRNIRNPVLLPHLQVFCPTRAHLVKDKMRILLLGVLLSALATATLRAESLDAIDMVTVGRVTATAHYANTYRSSGSMEIWINLHNDDAGVYGLDTYHDFAYRLVNRGGRVIPTLDLSKMSHLPIEGGPTAVASPSWPYGISLAKVYGHLSPGQYVLTVEVEPRDGRFPPFTLPPMHITVSDASGYIGSPSDP